MGGWIPNVLWTVRERLGLNLRGQLREAEHQLAHESARAREREHRRRVRAARMIMDGYGDNAVALLLDPND